MILAPGTTYQITLEKLRFDTACYREPVRLALLNFDIAQLFALHISKPAIIEHV